MSLFDAHLNSQEASSQEQDTTPKRSKEAFFKNAVEGDDPASPVDGHLSLRSYIKEHIQRQMDSDPTSESRIIQEKNKFHLYQPPVFDRELAENPSFGQQLYGLDTELSSGIEQYLPTPAVRLRIIKERLNGEIATLEEHLEQYRAIKKPSLKVVEKIGHLQAKLGTLRHHEQKVDLELIALFHQRSSFFQVANTFRKVKNQLDNTAETLLPEFSIAKLFSKIDPLREEMDALNLELQDLTALLQEQMKRRNMNVSEVSDVVNQYDHTIQKIDRLTQQLMERKSWWKRLNDRLQQIYRTIYTG